MTSGITEPPCVSPLLAAACTPAASDGYGRATRSYPVEPIPAADTRTRVSVNQESNLEPSGFPSVRENV
jgi:hypothetical protein